VDVPINSLLFVSQELKDNENAALKEDLAFYDLDHGVRDVGEAASLVRRERDVMLPFEEPFFIKDEES